MLNLWMGLLGLLMFLGSIAWSLRAGHRERKQNRKLFDEFMAQTEKKIEEDRKKQGEEEEEGPRWP